MANFKAALEALAVGKLKHESLSKQLDSVLRSSPNFINKMLNELDEVYGQKKLNDKQYSVLKDQIVKFRQAHTSILAPVISGARGVVTGAQCIWLMGLIIIVLIIIIIFIIITS